MTPQTLAQEVNKLFTLPDVAIRLNELIRAPDSSTQDLADVVRLDPGLAAALLKLANSAYYGLSAKVDSIVHAIAVIGQRELQSMAMAAAVLSTFKGLPEDLVDMASFWDNSVTCGVLARALGRRCGMRQTEQLFLAGLLHGVGKLVFYARRPREYRALLLAVEHRDERTLAEAEARVFGFDYAILGAELLRAWQLPEMLRTLVARQLHPGDEGELQRQASLLHVATDMAACLAPTVKGTAFGECRYQPRIEPAAWAALELDEAVIPEVMREANLQAIEILAIINPRATMIY